MKQSNRRVCGLCRGIGWPNGEACLGCEGRGYTNVTPKPAVRKADPQQPRRRGRHVTLRSLES